MANTVLPSTSTSGMVAVPLWLQAVGADSAVTYSATNDRALIDALYSTSGVLNLNSFAVSQRGAGANFSVDITSGFAVIAGGEVANQGKYLVQSTAVVNCATPTAPVSGTRVHRIIARIRDKQAVGSGTYDWTIELLEDTGSGTPAQPVSAITLATVSIAAGQPSVSNTNITDLRTATSDAASPVLFVRRTVEAASVLTTNLADDTQLFVTVGANSVYELRSFILYTSSSTANFKIGWSAPAGSTLDWNIGGPSGNQNTPTGIPYNGYNNLAGTDSVGGSGALANPIAARPSGLLITGNAGGLFRFRWAQATTDNVNGTNIKASSYLLLTRVG